MSIALPPLTRPVLLARLAEGADAGITVLTPNSRLAQSLLAELDRAALAAGRVSWEAPDILPFAAYVERCHREARFGPEGAHLPTLLSAGAESLLWEEAVRASRWAGRPESAAALAAQAWTLAHAWRIEGALEAGEGGEDAQAFAAWCAHYRRHTARHNLVDAARLPGLAAARFASQAARPPALLVLHGLDLATPQQADFLESCARAGSELARTQPPSEPGQACRVCFDSPRAELEAAARWARERLERSKGAARIAVVVPQLGTRRAEVARVFERVLGGPSPTQPGAVPPFNLSLGMPLASYALVDAALDLLDLAAGSLAFDRVSRLLRSPFLAGAEREREARARADAALRGFAPAALSAARLRALLPQAAVRAGAPCPALLERLDRLALAAGAEGRAAPPDWARRFTARLEAAGFPGERTLDSAEFQALGRWREVLAEYAALAAVAGSWGAAEARARLRRLCADATFQPASGAAPVQVLGILESAGLGFDHLWVSGLTEEAWPLAAHPHPLIAPALQRLAGIPGASAERSLEVDAALTESWHRAAPEVLFTSARADGDRELLASPLIARFAEIRPEALGIPAFATWAGALFAAGREPGAIATRPDTVAPALGDAAGLGGTAVLADQAACPFRAFAHFRLEARALEAPQPGLTPAERGHLLHRMMARLWSALGDQATLQATAQTRLAELIDEAAAYAVAGLRGERPGRLEGRFADLERERLGRVANEWLAVERARPAFEVCMREAKMTLSAGNLRLSGRVDRVDRLVDGGLAVIDYKSGTVSVSSWLGPRPDDAQLPLYALAAGEDEIRAVAFARLKVGDLGFAGLARDDAAWPGVRPVDKHAGARKLAASWSEQLAAWREALDTLGENYASGDARIDPKRGLATCERCDLSPLCRVHERHGAIAAEAPVEEEA